MAGTQSYRKNNNKLLTKTSTKNNRRLPGLKSTLIKSKYKIIHI